MIRNCLAEFGYNNRQIDDIINALCFNKRNLNLLQENILRNYQYFISIGYSKED